MTYKYENLNLFIDDTFCLEVLSDARSYIDEESFWGGGLKLKRHQIGVDKQGRDEYQGAEKIDFWVLTLAGAVDRAINKKYDLLDIFTDYDLDFRKDHLWSSFCKHMVQYFPKKEKKNPKEKDKFIGFFDYDQVEGRTHAETLQYLDDIIEKIKHNLN